MSETRRVKLLISVFENMSLGCQYVTNMFEDLADKLRPECGATEWHECDEHEGMAYVYRICTLPEQHAGYYHAQHDVYGNTFAESSGDSGPITLPVCPCSPTGKE